MAIDPHPVVGAVLTWRRVLMSDTGASRAASARLRHASCVRDALMREETLGLIRAVRQADGRTPSHHFEQRLVVLAMLLAHIDGESKTPFARALGQTASGLAPFGHERPLFSPTRFAALMRSANDRDWDGFARALRRAVVILGNTPIDVARLIGDVLYLSDATLCSWAYDYWQTSAPTQDEPTQDEPAQSSAKYMEVTS